MLASTAATSLEAPCRLKPPLAPCLMVMRQERFLNFLLNALAFQKRDVFVVGAEDMLV